MSLAPDIVEILARARSDLRMGVPVVLFDRNDAVIIGVVETLNAERLADLRGLGNLVLALTARRAETLKARVYDGDIARIQVPKTAPISWLHSLADPADDLQTPMKGPFTSIRDGRPDLYQFAVQLAKSARLLPAVVTAALDTVGNMGNVGEIAKNFAKSHALTIINTEAAIPELKRSSQLHPVVSARLPIAASEAGRLHVFRPEDGSDEHYAIEIGRPARNKPVLVRLHSACFTGDVLGSLKCDCGPQLHAALAQMGHEEAGVLLYLNQEGRGIGLANKMRAYSLQNQGFDTVEANHRLGFEDDERDFKTGVNILKSMGFSKIRLMTNNPKKIAMMEANGIDVVERVPLIVGENAHNSAYLATKAKKSGHLL